MRPSQRVGGTRSCRTSAKTRQQRDGDDFAGLAAGGLRFGVSRGAGSGRECRRLLASKYVSTFHGEGLTASWPAFMKRMSTTVAVADRPLGSPLAPKPTFRLIPPKRRNVVSA